MSPSPTRPAPPVLGGKYRLEKLLGQGGMGAVYEATNTWIGRKVAIKVLHPSRSGDAKAVGRLLGEASAAARTRHPNIVDVLDVERGRSGEVYIVYELLTGTDLRTRMDRERRLSVRDALDVVVPVMGALVAAHREGVVHLDVKPENIFLAQSPSGRVLPKVIDFGIARVLTAADAAPGGESRGAHGTLDYMAPEQLRGDADVDGRADVWSLGVVLYELLSGVMPFHALHPNRVATRILSERPPEPLGRLAPSVPSALCEVVHRALEPDRVRRHPTMVAFLDALLAAPGVEAEVLVREHRSSLPGKTASIPAPPPDLLDEAPPAPELPAGAEDDPAEDEALDEGPTHLYVPREPPSYLLTSPPLPRGAWTTEGVLWQPSVPPASRRVGRAVLGATLVLALAAVAVLLGALAARRSNPLAPSRPEQVPASLVEPPAR